MKFPQEEILINEVVLRDGLQLEEKVVSVEEKEKLFLDLKKAGVQSFEFGSFVHPKRVPQMANSGELFTEIKSKAKDTELIALIPNLKGAELAHERGVQVVNFVFSVSDTHNEQNVQKSTESSLEEVKELKKYCTENEMQLNVTMATSFGCPFEGEVPEKRVRFFAKQVSEQGIGILTLADTTGMANPKQVYDLLTAVRKDLPNQKLGLHFHNTRGMGLANILAGIEAGITCFDTALGGLGGCPFAPGATGNVCTEDVVHMLHNMGMKTNVDLDLLIKTSERLEEIVGHETESYLLRAGPSNRKYSVPVS